MPTVFFAHSTGHDDKHDWQKLSEHLTSVGSIAADNASSFGGQSLARASGMLHDLGKYTDQFQRRLAGDISRVDHATWGARIAQERYAGLGTLIAYTIAGHHAGLANGRSGAEGLTRSPLADRLSDAYCDGQLPPLQSAWQQEIDVPSTLRLPEGFVPHPQGRNRIFQLTLLTRMIFSCLVDADFVDTDNFYRRVEGRPGRDDGATISLEELRARLNTCLDNKPRDGEVNSLRRRILDEVRDRASWHPGLFLLTVPTGGGKTLTSLAFALDHAIANSLRRVIYVIPFTSIVEQTAQVFRDALGDVDGSIVLEHHSGFYDDPTFALQAREKRKLAMENWAAPIVVTTAVQFFESLFADRPSRCRKLHNITGSSIILDEAQTLPLQLLRPCVALIDELARNYRTSLVLCTATQPALTTAAGFKDGLENARELAPNPIDLYQRLRRVRVRHVGVANDDDLADRLRQRDQVLCIVNNRRQARRLFEAIADAPGACHLTTLMYARHRSHVLTKVRQQLRDGEPCRLVSTSLIEAGVDVDFPTVLRAEAGLDSIAQAAGRCNREGRRSIESSETLIFEAPDWPPPPELKLFAEAFRAIERRYRDDLLSLDAVTAYFQELYWRLGEQRLDREDLMGLIQSSTPDALPFETLAAKFRIIRTAMRPIIVPFDPYTGTRIRDVDKAIDELEFAPGVARKLQPFLVQVPQAAYDALSHAHAIQAVAPEKYGDQFVRLINPRLYDAQFGLHWDDPQFLAAERLVI